MILFYKPMKYIHLIKIDDKCYKSTLIFGVNN